MTTFEPFSNELLPDQRFVGIVQPGMPGSPDVIQASLRRPEDTVVLDRMRPVSTLPDFGGQRPIGMLALGADHNAPRDTTLAISVYSVGEQSSHAVLTAIKEVTDNNPGDGYLLVARNSVNAETATVTGMTHLARTVSFGIIGKPDYNNLPWRNAVGETPPDWSPLQDPHLNTQHLVVSCHADGVAIRSADWNTTLVTASATPAHQEVIRRSAAPAESRGRKFLSAMLMRSI